MKMSFFYRRGPLVLLIFCCLASCGKTKPAATNPVTPFQNLINTDTSFSIFHRMVLQANDAGFIGNDSVTFLIPTNDAFRLAGYNEDALDTFPSSVANRLISYSYIRSRAIPDGNTYAGYSTQLGYTLYGMTDAAHQRWFNGIPVTGDTVNAGNVLVYRLSAPLQPPADSLALLLSNDSSLTFLAEVFRRTNLDSLVSSGSFTLLAPVNSAFIAAGYDSVGAIDAADSGALAQLVKYHTLTGEYFTNILMGVSTAPTLQGSSVTVNGQNGGLQFSGPNNPAPANWLSGNQLAGSTLIVHRIDRVLSP